MNGRRTLCLLLLGLALLPVSLAGQEQSLTLSQEARKNLGIELATAQRRDIHDILEVRGMLREQLDRVVLIHPPAKGQIVKVHYKPADRVRKGAVLLTLYCPELEKLRTELAQELETTRLIEQELERVESLVDRGILAARDLRLAQMELALARSRAQAARRGITLLGVTEKELGNLLDDPDRPAYLPIHSPIGGHVTSRDAYPGEMVEPERRLLRIMDTSVLWAEADVFERDVPRIREGLSTSMLLRPFKELRFEGVIRAISATLSAGKRTAHLWIEVKNAEGRLKPQMAVDISILLDTTTNALTVPRQAVLEDGGERFVFVTNGDAFLRQRVVVGRKDHQSCEISEGVYEGDQVVTKGSHELKLALTSQGVPLGSDGHLHGH